MKRLWILLLMATLISCGVEKKIRKAQAVAYQYPQEFASFCSTTYPVIPTYIKGKDSVVYHTETIKGDSIPCPPIEGKSTFVKCPDIKVQYRDVFRVDTIEKENTAKISDLSHKLASVTKYNNKLNDDIEKQKERNRKLLFWLISVSIILIGSIVLKVRKWIPF